VIVAHQVAMQIPAVLRPCNEKTSRLRGGFTLVELLVVIVLVATLTTLAAVGIRGGITASRQAASSMNLRNIGVALQSYADDYNGVYPETTHSTGLAALDGMFQATEQGRSMGLVDSAVSHQ
jgi:prepilin-type N-terminal cleavage/methylation domain-containing protein